MIFFAQSLDRFTPGAIGWTVIGLASALSLAALILTVLILGRKWFGRQPTFDEIIKTLLSVEDFTDYQEEQRLRHRGLEEQISKVRHDTDERFSSDMVRADRIFKDIFRRGEARDQIVATLRDSMAAMQERTTQHIRQFDALFTKCDRLLERMPREGHRYPKREGD